MRHGLEALGSRAKPRAGLAGRSRNQLHKGRALDGRQVEQSRGTKHGTRSSGNGITEAVREAKHGSRHARSPIFPRERRRLGACRGTVRFEAALGRHVDDTEPASGRRLARTNPCDI